MRYLLAFGTENYRDESHRLPQVPAELDTIVALFTRNGYQEQLTELRHDPAAHDLKQALETWLHDDALNVDDIVVIYYTGHGFTHLGRHYLATADTRLGITSSALKAEELVEVIESGPTVRRVLLILDVCYAEAGALDAAQVAARHPASTGPSVPGQGIWLIASSRRREEASQAAFSTAFADAVASASTAPIQQYHALESLMEATNRILGDRQQAGFVTGTVATGLAPFITNPAYDPHARPGDDLETASRRHNDLRTHFDPKARGVDVATQEGRYFRGRGEATESILSWLGAQATRTRVCVVTGQPGAGKSALLGHVLFLSNPELRSDTQQPPQSDLASFDSVVLAKGMTHQAVLDAIESDVHIRAGDANALGEKLWRRGREVTVLVDGLDEADGADAVIKQVLNPLATAGQGRVRLLVGTRRSEVAKFGQHVTLLDLDSPAYYSPDDVAAYVYAVLIGAEKSPYRDEQELAAAAADEVARRAKGSFLIARVAARTLSGAARPKTAVEVAEAGPLWEAVGTAFDHDLSRYAHEANRVRDLLLPLAFARGQGLPESLWAGVASALTNGFHAYSDDDVRWLQLTAGSYVVVVLTDTGEAVYRLIHQELADHLRGDAAKRAQRENRIFSELMTRAPLGPSGERNWLAADPYLRRHLATHARESGNIDELLREPGFVLAAEPVRLRRAAVHRGSTRGAAAAGVVLSNLEHRDRSLADRAAILALSAVLREQDEMARATEKLVPQMPWRCIWADWRPADPHRTLTHMSAPVSDLVAWEWKPDYWRVAAAAARAVRVVDVESARVDHEIQVSGRVNCMVVLTVGGPPLLAVGCDDGALHVIDTSTWASTTLAAFDGQVTALSVGVVDGEQAVVVAGNLADDPHPRKGHVRLWRIHGPDTGAWEALTPQRAAMGGYIRNVHVVHLAGRDCVVVAGDPLHEPDQEGGMVRLLDPGTLERLGSMQEQRTGYIVSCHVAGTLLVTRRYMGTSEGHGHVLTVWDLEHSSALAEHELPRGGTAGPCLAQVPARAHPAIAVANSEQIELFDSQSLEPLSGWRPIEVEDVSALCPAESVDRSLLLSGGSDAAVRVWDLGWKYTTAGFVDTRGGPRWVAIGDRNEKPVGVLSGSNHVDVRDLHSGEVLHRWEVDAPTVVACCEGRVFVATGAEVRSFDLVSFAEGPAFVGSTAKVRTVATAVIEGRLLLATAGDDHVGRMWDATSGHLLPHCEFDSGYADKEISSLDFIWIGNRRRLVSGSYYGTVAHSLDVLSDGVSKNLPDNKELPLTHAANVRTVMQIGTLLYSGGDDQRIHGLDLETNRTVCVVDRAHRDGVSSLACAQLDGQPVVISGGGDGQVRIWDAVLDPVASIPLDSRVLAITASGSTVLVGTRAGAVALDLTALSRIGERSVSLS